MKNRVLVIDDEENIRNLSRLTLETAGYEVGESRSAEEALAILGSDDSWDVILLDQKLPGMLGTDVLRRLRVLAPRARVVIVTAFASMELAIEAMRKGASDLLCKPMTPETLRDAVASALRRGRENQTGRLPAVEDLTLVDARAAESRSVDGNLTVVDMGSDEPRSVEGSPDVEPDELDSVDGNLTVFDIEVGELTKRNRTES